MLAQGIKLDGSVMLQIRGNGSDQNGDGRMSSTEPRCAPFCARTMAMPPIELVSRGAGQLAITLKPHRGQMYQGIVRTWRRTRLRARSRRYFDTSEQLPTRIWATASPHAAAGLMLQRMPDPQHARPPELDQIADAWHRIQMLADTVTDRELLDAVRGAAVDASVSRRSRPRSAAVEPRRSAARVRENARRTHCASWAAPKWTTSSRRKVESTVTCEFCGRTIGYDPIDARLLFEPLATGLPSSPQ